MPFFSYVNNCTDIYEAPDKQAPHPYDHMEMAQHFPTFPSSLPSAIHSTYCTATSLMLFNSDVCCIGDWVLFSLPTGNREAPALGHIQEIIVSLDGADVAVMPPHYKQDWTIKVSCEPSGKATSLWAETSHTRPTSHYRGLLEHMSFIQGPREDSCSGWDVEDQEDKLDSKSDYSRAYIHLDLYYLLSYY